MHILEIDDTPEAAAAGVAPGKTVCLDTNAFELAQGYQHVRPKVYPYVEPLHAVNERILIIFTMGYGDAIMLTPVLRELKKRHPKGEIILSTWEWTQPVFLNLPYVDGFLKYPVRLEELQDFGSIVTLEHSVEYNLLARTQHMTDRFAQHLELGSGDWTDNKKPDLILSTDEKDWAKTTFPRKGKLKRLGLQVQAGVRHRTYPISQIGSQKNDKGGYDRGMMDLMLQDGWEICFLGLPGEFRPESTPPGMIDMTRFGLTWRQSAAFLTTCDVVLAPDSSMMHAAGALDVPCVALFGPFPYDLRTRYYQSVFALHGNGACPMAPCFHSFHLGTPLFPKDGPCNETGICAELAAISPERIRAKIEQLASTP